MAVRTDIQPVKVTVGIPTFNRAGWLRESIESVLAQTFTDFRLVVSDNASDDDTPEVVRSFDDDRIHYVRSQRNVGPVGNSRRLIALAETTEFLVLLPDDDVLYPGHLQRPSTCWNASTPSVWCTPHSSSSTRNRVSFRA